MGAQSRPNVDTVPNGELFCCWDVFLGSGFYAAMTLDKHLVGAKESNHYFWVAAESIASSGVITSVDV